VETQRIPTPAEATPRRAAVSWSPQARLQWLGEGARRQAPTVVTAILVGCLARYYEFAKGFRGSLGFAIIGSQFAQRAGWQDLAISPVGFDGQFYYYLARAPELVVRCARLPATCPIDAPALRMERILYPLTAWALAFGQVSLVPKMLLLLNLVGILVTCLVVGQLCVEAGASRWLGAGAALFAGNILGLLRDLPDPFSGMWLMLALWCLYKQRYVRGAVAVALLLLTREQAIFFLPFLALPLLARRRWATLAVCSIIVCLPFAAWQIVLRALYGHWALRDSAVGNHLATVPFGGLRADWAYLDAGVMVVEVAIPVTIAVLIGLAGVWRAGPRGLLYDPMPLALVVFGLLVSLMGSLNWMDMWSPARLAAPVALLGVVVAAKLSPTLGAAYATLVAVTATAPLVMRLL
jgi:hypothetical protein